MATCPQCQRPIAVARASCLYCGAALDPALVPVRSESAPLETPAAAEDRALVVIEAGGCDTETMARILALSVLEAGQRQRRGWHLHRIASPPDAEAEAARLRASGLKAVVLPESEARPSARPRLAEGGRRGDEALELRADGGVLRVSSADVLLIVAGSIHRERQSAELRRHQQRPTLFPGYRFHLHLRHDRRPLEIDPEAFAFDEALAAPAASLLELRSWLDGLGAPIDDGFRLLPPALGVATPADDVVSRALPATRRADPDAPAVLDNLAQFRFYSGWRAALERTPRG